MTTASIKTELKPAAAPLGGSLNWTIRTGVTDLLSIGQLTTGLVHTLFETTSAWKAEPAAYKGVLAGKSIVMLFEKPSLRTHVTFEIGLTRLGAHVMYLDHSKQKLGERESVKDYAKNLERWADAIVARVFSHKVLEEMAEHARIPVVNALSDLEHPCQALADLFTIQERLGTLEGKRLAYVGDGNNVCHSLLLCSALLGVDMTVVSPKGFEPQFAVVRQALKIAEKTGAQIAITNNLDNVKGHHAVYTDAWVSMGQSHQTPLRKDSFENFQVDEDVMERASAGIEGGALFMHCLPAHRGEEVVDAVIDADYSVVYDQAENRMHVQNALMMMLLGDVNG
ncbi:MAG: ornithine carbamoyltransferase [Phycisphaeraceae bacterium]|nr:ornithine carbamoyltransferase [Phycisphaeraceae bacterium]MCW5762666.1 ornithine carbamoyltransferase [Phycisphaeraceae bacterium]